MAVLVTGAGGFIGRTLVERLVAAGETARALARQLPMDPAEGAAWETLMLTPDMPLPAAWLEGVEVLYHLAAVVHRPRVPERELQRVNVALSAALARQAAAAGVRRFVFLSSVAAQATTSRRPLTQKDPPRPETAYGRSKLKAEAALAAVAAETGLEATVLRPPLVIGPGAPGNVARLLAWARAGRWRAPRLPTAAAWSAWATSSPRSCSPGVIRRQPTRPFWLPARSPDPLARFTSILPAPSAWRPASCRCRPGRCALPSPRPAAAPWRPASSTISCSTLATSRRASAGRRRCRWKRKSTPPGAG